MFDGLYESLLEVTLATLRKGQSDIGKLFQDFSSKVKGVGSAGGVKVSSAGRGLWRFKAASASEPGTKYEIPLFMTNIKGLLAKHVADKSLWVSNGQRVDISKLSAAMYPEVDYKLTCSCPAFQYYGGAYKATKDGYKYGKQEVRPPKVKNPKNYGTMCFTGDTEVVLLDGSSFSIYDMFKNRGEFIGKEVLSVNERTLDLEPDSIADIFRSGEGVDVVRVELDSGELVECTPNHRFMLRDGSYEIAGNLVGKSLMPLYMEEDLGFMRGYLKVYCPKDGKYRMLHSVVANYIHGRKRKGFVDHHMDFDKKNNEGKNLKRMEKIDHVRLHGGHMKGISKNYDTWNKGKTKGTSDRVLRNAEGIKRAWADPKVRKFMRERIREGVSTEEYRAGASERAKRHGGTKCHKEGCMCIICRRSRGETVVVKRAPWGEKAKQKLRDTLRRKFDDEPEYRDGFRKRASERTRDASGRFAVKNHKVISIKPAGKRDVYDISIKRNSNFPLKVGVFVHNCKHMQLVSDVLPFYKQSFGSYLKKYYATDIKELEKQVLAAGEDPKDTDKDSPSSDKDAPSADKG